MISTAIRLGLFGVLFLGVGAGKKPGTSVTIIFIDPGLEKAKITLSAIGTDFEQTKGK